MKEIQSSSGDMSTTMNSSWQFLVYAILQISKDKRKLLMTFFYPQFGFSLMYQIPPLFQVMLMFKHFMQANK